MQSDLWKETLCESLWAKQNNVLQWGSSIKNGQEAKAGPLNFASSSMYSFCLDITEEICGATDSCFSPVPYLAWYGNPEGSSDSERSGPVGREVMFLTLGVPLWLGLVLLLDSGLVARTKEFLARLIEQSRQHPANLQAPPRLDDDVTAERARVMQIFNSKNSIKSWYKLFL